jgi:circadian clock protein KaiC
VTESEMQEKLTRHSTGVPGLDEILHGGLVTGSLYLVRGTPGAGKTVLANQVCFHSVRRGDHCLYITLLSESHDRLMQNLAKLDFYSEELAENIHYQSGFHALEEEGLRGVLRMLAEETKRYHTRLVVLDGLFVLQEKTDSEREFRLFVNQLQNLAHLTGCIMLLLTNSERGSGSPEYTMVDGWFELATQQYSYRVHRYLQVHKLRGSSFAEGQHSLKISDTGVTVLPRLETVSHSRGHPELSQGTLSTGIPSLDQIMGGGVSRSSNTLCVGPSGVGKTTYGLHFVSEATAEEPGLIYGFYETKEDLIEKAELLGITGFKKGLDSGAIEVIWHAPSEHLLDELGHRLIAAVRERGVKRLFLDGIDGLQQSSLHAERMSRFLAALTNVLREAGVTAIYSLETPELISGESHIQFASVSSISQNIVLLRYSEVESAIERTVTIVKTRVSASDRRVRAFYITDNGVQIAGPSASADEAIGKTRPGSPKGTGSHE